ncbi:recombinase family protein [Defluviimonas sp. WL0024]|uniref:Recombinase family protein n=1 Tax=Albidovulum salinarum TaxID=2984153 RepID=A0ABT2X9E4_9RHOB|nr:recombinase family protein [Defluviimonas sp. WL0024]MCU9850562.1 recombinase family protein [Defluviimonas sp. WL0024]
MLAAIYARYSTDMQSAASIEDQVHVCRKLIDGRGWTAGPVYPDMAISGSTHLRPGYLQMQEDAQAGRFEVLVAESLDRLSRDQEHIAGLYKQLAYLDILIVTVAEGEISEMHIGLKGTMSALFLKDLAQKTRRGQEGRARDGKSAGGKCYGYRVVRRFNADGSPVTGEREIEPAEAVIVERIFRAYVTGQSSRAIAAALNAEGVPGPSGKAWGASTIHGNPKRGTGILNNELYVGRLVWNRQRYVKDPATGKRQARLNPADALVVQPVPDLRIIEDALWEAAKARQEDRRHDMQAPDGATRPERARRPLYLFSGLLKFGCCGASYTLVGKTRYGCAAARNKGTCDNRRTIERDEVEARVLDGLKEHLLHPDLIAEFVAEYQREYNRLMQSDRAKRSRLETELGQVTRKIDQIVDAIADGMRHPSMNDKLTELEDRKAVLAAGIEALGEEEPIRLHPGLAGIYRAKVADLAEALDAPETRQEAAQLIRGLLSEIRMIPGEKGHAIELVGALASILALGEAETTKPRAVRLGAGSVTVVAGVGFEPTTFRL